MPTRTDAEFETQIVLEAGTLEFMIDGATAVIAAPNLVRVAPGVAHAYRNVGHDTARILLRTVRPVPPRRTIRAHVEFAA